MTLEAFDIREADTPIALARTRCSHCQGWRLLEKDGLCWSCLHYPSVSVKPHEPRPRWLVTASHEGVVVFRDKFLRAESVEHVREMFGAGNVKVEVLP